MKTIAIFSVVAAALLLAGCATPGADTQRKTCYRTVQTKAPYRVAVPCKTGDMNGQPAQAQKP